MSGRIVVVSQKCSVITNKRLNSVRVSKITHKLWCTDVQINFSSARFIH